jgi:hypothetical protein
MSELLEQRKKAATLAKDPFIRRLVLRIGIGATVLFAGLSAFLWWIVPWRWLKVAFCYLSLTIILILLLQLLFSILPITVRPKSFRRLAAFLALWVTVAIYFVSNQTFRWLLAGGIALLFMAFIFITGLLRFLVDWYFPRTAFKEFQKGQPGKWGRIGLVVSEKGIATRHARRLAKELANEMMVARGRNQGFMFMPLDWFRRFPSEFERSAAEKVPALMVVRRAYGQTDRKFDNAVEEHNRVASGLIFRVLLIRSADDLAPIQDFRGIETCPFMVSHEQREREEIREIISVITGQLTTTAIPIGESDDKLPAELRATISKIVTHALPPLANCYLRFRLSRSNVERFLCLLDCFEVLIKVSVIYSLVQQWRRDGNSQLAQLYTQLGRPSLGTWLDTLRRLNAEPGQDDLAQAICAFWKEPLAGAPRQLISDAKGSGLAYPGDLPRSHLGWLDWFVWLRNTTRGHGGVEEGQVGPIWHGLHATFLRMARGLTPLIADSSLATTLQNGSLVACSGWNRNLLPESTQEGKVPMPANPVFMVRNGASEGNKSLLHPFVIKAGDDFLTWNSARENAVEYLDYGTGQVRQIKSDEVNPYHLWQLWQAKG